jgi:hypothetical protein
MAILKPFATFYGKWLWVAFSKSLGIADLIASVIAAIAAVVVHYTPQAQRVMTDFPSGKAWFYLDFSPYTKKFPMPIAWQGWATLAAMIAWTVGSIWLLDAIGVPRHSWILTVWVMLSVVVFVFAVYSKTRIEY